MTEPGQSSRVGLTVLTVVVLVATGFGWYAVSDAWRHAIEAGIAATVVWGLYTAFIVAALCAMWRESS